jgi:hypothetical protein
MIFNTDPPPVGAAGAVYDGAGATGDACGGVVPAPASAAAVSTGDALAVASAIAAPQDPQNFPVTGAPHFPQNVGIQISPFNGVETRANVSSRGRAANVSLNLFLGLAYESVLENLGRRKTAVSYGCNFMPSNKGLKETAMQALTAQC